MGRRIYEVTDAYEYSGQSVYRDTEAEAIKDSEEDIRQNDYYYIEVSDVDGVMFKAIFYKLKYEKLLRDLAGANPPMVVTEEEYEKKKNTKMDFLSSIILKRVPYYIVVGKDIETRENFLN